MYCFSILSVVMVMMAEIQGSTQQENSSADLITSQLTKFSISLFQVSDAHSWF